MAQSYSFRIQAEGLDQFKAQIDAAAKSNAELAAAWERIQASSPQLVSAMQRAEQATDRMTQASLRGREANDNMAASGGKLGTILQSAGYQVQDFAGQVANGTSAVTAFAQQAPQLLSVFGPAGIFAGAAIAVGAVALKFLDMGESAETAAKRAEANFKGVKESQESLATAIDEVNKLYQTQEQRAAAAADASRKATRRKIEMSQQELITMNDGDVAELAVAKRDLAQAEARIQRRDVDIFARTGSRTNDFQAGDVSALFPLRARVAALEADISRTTEQLGRANDAAARLRDAPPATARTIYELGGGTVFPIDAVQPAMDSWRKGLERDAARADRAGAREDGRNVAFIDRTLNKLDDARWRDEERQIADAEKARERAAAEAQRMEERAAEERRRRDERVTDDITRYGADAFAGMLSKNSRGFAGFLEDMEAAFKRTAARLVADVILRPVVSDVVGSLGLGNLGGTGGSASGLLSSAWQGISGLFSGGSTGTLGNAVPAPSLAGMTTSEAMAALPATPTAASTGVPGLGGIGGLASAASLANTVSGGGLFSGIGSSLGLTGAGGALTGLSSWGGLLGGGMATSVAAPSLAGMTSAEAMASLPAMPTAGTTGVSSIGAFGGIAGGIGLGMLGGGIVSSVRGSVDGMRNSAIGSVAGAGIGFLVGGPVGALIGGAVGGTAGGFFGPTQKGMAKRSGGDVSYGLDENGKLVITGSAGKRWDAAGAVAEIQGQLDSINSGVAVRGLTLSGDVGGLVGFGQASTNPRALDDREVAAALRSDNALVQRGLSTLASRGTGLQSTLNSVDFITNTYEPIIRSTTAADGLAYQIEQVGKKFADLTKQAADLGLETDKLNLARDQEIAKLNAQASATAKGLLEQLTLGGLGGLSPEARGFAALSSLNAARQNASSAPGGLDDYARVAQIALPVIRDVFGTTERYGQVVGEVASTLRSLAPNADQAGLASLLEMNANGSDRVAEAVLATGGDTNDLLGRLLNEFTTLRGQLEALARRTAA
jgi:hypothetical protein